VPDSYYLDRLIDISWKVEVFKGQPPMTFNGTIQQVYEQVLVVNPAFELATVDNDLAKREHGGGEELLSKRTPTYCAIHTSDARVDSISRCITYLRGVGGAAENQAGGCGKVACESDSAIWWCNDVS
jgi:hypothetical protein